MKKCYHCGQEYYIGCTHNCPTNWNTRNCEEIENKIMELKVLKIQLEVQEALFERNLAKELYENAKKEFYPLLNNLLR